MTHATTSIGKGRPRRAESPSGRLRLFRIAAAHRRTRRNDLMLGAILAFVAGAINAGGFLAIGHYTSHMTGIVSAIADNLALGNYREIAPRGWVAPRAVEGFAARAIARFGIKGQGGQRAGQLSGGNQQKVVIAKSISRGPKVVILDEPTRGIDVGARAAIYEVIADLARRGMAVIVVSSDLDEVLGLAHRILVLSRGRARGVLDRAAAGRVEVMELATT